MTTYVTGPGFPFIFEFPDHDDIRDISAKFRDLIHDRHCVTLMGMPGDSGISTTLLINFALISFLVVTAVDPEDGEEDPDAGTKMRLPTTMEGFVASTR